jgi:hypothetical protein
MVLLNWLKIVKMNLNIRISKIYEHNYQLVEMQVDQRYYKWYMNNLEVNFNNQLEENLYKFKFRVPYVNFEIWMLVEDVEEVQRFVY